MLHPCRGSSSRLLVENVTFLVNACRRHIQSTPSLKAVRFWNAAPYFLGTSRIQPHPFSHYAWPCIHRNPHFAWIFASYFVLAPGPVWPKIKRNQRSLMRELARRNPHNNNTIINNRSSSSSFNKSRRNRNRRNKVRQPPAQMTALPRARRPRPSPKALLQSLHPLSLQARLRL